MSRVHNGMLIRTSYGTGPFRIVTIKKDCTCPSFTDELSLGKDASLSKPHYHFTCENIGVKREKFWLNGYDENLKSVWNGDRIIVCAEETLFLTMCCGL